jgi:4-methylaminobutanoate oxidase (formaldehyde-forming)
LAVVKSLPGETRVVVIGGGIIGCSLAYHLTKLGWRDVVLLERKKLTCGTTWHAAGLVREMLGSQVLTRLAQVSMALFKTLEAETGQATGLKQNGSLGIAANAARWEEHRRSAGLAKACGIEVELVGPEQARELYPLLNVDDVHGAIFFPNDGQTNPADTTMALAKGARMGGAQIFEDTKVTGVLTERGRAAGVRTEHGEIKAEYVVNCAGLWGSRCRCTPASISMWSPSPWRGSTPACRCCATWTAAPTTRRTRASS